MLTFEERGGEVRECRWFYALVGLAVVRVRQEKDWKSACVVIMCITALEKWIVIALQFAVRIGLVVVVVVGLALMLRCWYKKSREAVGEAAGEAEEEAEEEAAEEEEAEPVAAEEEAAEPEAEGPEAAEEEAAEPNLQDDYDDNIEDAAPAQPQEAAVVVAEEVPQVRVRKQTRIHNVNSGTRATGWSLGDLHK